MSTPHHQHRRLRSGAIAPIVTAAFAEDSSPTTGAGVVPAAGPDYPCVRRSRHRRLLTFLWLQGFKDAFRSMAGETDAFFSVPLLRQLVEEGQWTRARDYLSRFLPFWQWNWDSDSDTARLSMEARAIYLFLWLQLYLANVVDGSKGADMVAANCKYNTYLNHGKTVRSGCIRIRSIVLNILHAKQYFRASFDWERMRRKASEIVDDLAYRIPELKDSVLMPGGPMKPQNVLPIGFGLRPRYRFKKQARRPRASTLAKRFLSKKSLPVSSNQESRDVAEVLDKALNWAADAIDDCLKAGKRRELHQESPLQPSANESAPCNPALQSTLGTSTNHAVNHMVSSIRAGVPVVPAVYQTMYGNMAGPVRNSLVPVLANTNQFANRVLRKPAAPFLGTMFRTPVLQTMLPNHVPTPGAPFSQTVWLLNKPG